MHGGVMGRKPVARRMVRQIGEPQRARLADQQTENTLAVRQVPDRRPLLRGETQGEEFDQVLAIAVQHTESAVLGVHQFTGGAHYSRQDVTEFEISGHCDDRVQQVRQPLV